jgi:hypothetical protein
VVRSWSPWSELSLQEIWQSLLRLQGCASVHVMAASRFMINRHGGGSSTLCRRGAARTPDKMFVTRRQLRRAPFYKIHIRTDRHLRRANAASSSPASFTGADELTEGETSEKKTCDRSPVSPARPRDYKKHRRHPSASTQPRGVVKLRITRTTASPDGRAYGAWRTTCDFSSRSPIGR